MTIAITSPRTSPTGYPDFRELLGPAAWRRLPAAVRERFGAHQAGAAPVCYSGTMERVEASGLGRVLAWLARVFDTPVAPFTGRDIDVAVNVYETPENRGIVWERIYRFPGRAPVTVRSTKCLDHRGRLREALGGGLRMNLELFERDGALHFVSTHYVLALFGLQLRLPAWLPPGTTHVVHTDEGHGRFRFTLYTEHPWFGRMYFQDGVFCKTETDA